MVARPPLPIAPDVDSVTALTVAYGPALQQGIGSVLRGRPGRPAIRPGR